MPFTEETLEFLVRNKLMDSREWFHEHHGEYERLVVEPLADLVSALTPALEMCIRDRYLPQVYPRPRCRCPQRR